MISPPGVPITGVYDWVQRILLHLPLHSQSIDWLSNFIGTATAWNDKHWFAEKPHSRGTGSIHAPHQPPYAHTDIYEKVHKHTLQKRKNRHFILTSYQIRKRFANISLSYMILVRRRQQTVIKKWNSFLNKTKYIRQNTKYSHIILYFALCTLYFALRANGKICRGKNLSLLQKQFFCFVSFIEYASEVYFLLFDLFIFNPFLLWL